MMFLRTLLFKTAFYITNAVLCVAIFWVPLVPHRIALRTIQLYMRCFGVLERVLMGLDYRIEGLENLPKSGCYIAAIKHQSTWETYKVHEWIHNPATVMKAELRHIPLWGWYAAKLQTIFVERGKTRAYASLMEGGERAKAQGRPIIIFPQGTRVAYGEHRPYKRGVVELYAKLGVPIIPIALNSGKFWPRDGFMMRSGTITVKVLPPIMPGLDPAEALRTLENATENASNSL